MKFKTTAIAMAVAGIVAAPIAVQADGSVYASARIGIQSTDTGGKSDLDIRSFSSRFGAKGETDLGNGLTGYGHYEWDVDLGEEDPDGINVRHRYVGLKGDFGNVYIGQTYHAFYNHVVGPADPAYWNSGFAMIEYRGRTDETITYAGGGDAVSYAVSAVITADDEEDTPDQIEAGLSFGLGDMTLGFGFITTQADNSVTPSTGSSIGNSSDEDVMGVMLSGIALGDISLAVGLQGQDSDVGYNFALTMGGFYLVGEFESIDKDSQATGTRLVNGVSTKNVSIADTDPGGFTLGYEQTLGRNTKIWYEIHQFDADSGNSDDDVTQLQAVLRYDII
jgi:predicted porin